MNPVLLLLILPLAVIGIMLWMSGHAPEGYEDEAGFHLGREPRR